METTVHANIARQIRHVLDHAVIKDRRFLDDEQLIRSEQLAVLEEIFNANVREAEIKELSSHFAPILRGDHPVHLALWGKTGTGKTLTMTFFLNLLAQMCRERNIPLQHHHLDLSTPRPCFRALNDLACQLHASRRYRQGISLEELMLKIETKLASFRGYLILFVDECDNVRRDQDTFMTFLVRRLPQRIRAKLVLVFASNRLNWPDNLDPRVKSFLKLNELIFEPYDALDLQRILEIRVKRALHAGTVEHGVIAKIAALSSWEHGDARKAVALLARGAYLAEKAASKITVDLVDRAAQAIEQDRYLALIRTAPPQLQIVMASLIQASRSKRAGPLSTGTAYDAYKEWCDKARMRPLTIRAFGDLLVELDMYCLIRCRVHSRGRHGRTREIRLDLPETALARIHDTILMSFELRR